MNNIIQVSLHKNYLELNFYLVQVHRLHLSMQYFAAVVLFRLLVRHAQSCADYFEHVEEQNRIVGKTYTQEESLYFYS